MSESTEPLRAMLFSEVKAGQIEHFVTNPDVVFEQKMDGTRVLARYEEGEAEFFARTGAVLKHTASTQHLPAIERRLNELLGGMGPFWFDGELMHDIGNLYVFDLPMARFAAQDPVDLDTPFRERRETLEFLFGGITEGAVRISTQHTTPEAKRALVERVSAIQGEGVMVKHLHAVYEPGKRVRHSVKAKIVRSAYVSVIGVDRPDPKHGSITFGLWDGTDEGGIEPLGSCSAIGKPEVKVGDVIRVEYLSWMAGGALVQPRMVGVESGKRLIDCTKDQLVPYSKEILA
jgi:ATP-dependent DNA ligase